MGGRVSKIGLISLLVVLVLSSFGGAVQATNRAPSVSVSSMDLLENISIQGVVQAISETAIVVEERGAVYEIVITPETVIVGDPVVGDLVLVEALEGPAGLVALYIEVLDTRMVGLVEELSITTLRVSGQQFNVTGQTQFVGNVIVGARVDVRAIPAAGGSYTAVYVEVLGPVQGFMAFLPLIEK